MRVRLLAVLAFTYFGNAMAADETGALLCAGEQCRRILRDQSYPLYLSPGTAGTPSPVPSVAAQNRDGQSGGARNRAGRPDRIRVTQSHAQGESKEEGPGNLPPYMASADATPSNSSASGDTGFFMTFTSKKESLKGAKAGTVFNAVIEQAILASPTTANPITATITSGPLSGATLLGVATFGKELKCVLLNFSLLRSKDGESTYQLKGVGIAPSGEACIQGEYEAQNGRFFLAEMLATGTAVLVDSQVQRSQNALGNYVEEPSLSNAAKKGLAASLTKTAERSAEGMKSAPEFTRLAGFQPIRVIFQSDPIEN